MTEINKTDKKKKTNSKKRIVTKINSEEDLINSLEQLEEYIHYLHISIMTYLINHLNKGGE